MKCGKVSVNVDENTYEPKIVVDGYMMAGYRPSRIRIMRNFGLNRTISIEEIPITDAVVELTDIAEDRTIELTYSPVQFAYEYRGDDFITEYGKSYRLAVSATIDDQELFTTSTTTVPKVGFAIRDDESGPFALKYRQKDDSGNLIKFTVVFDRAPDTDSYVSSIVALDGDKATFIEDNTVGLKKDILDEGNHLQNLVHQGQWTQTHLNNTDGASFEVEWLTIWFYGRYRLVLYAADKNYTDYFLTHKYIQDMDGNLLEPKFHFEGDGIGVFGSAVPDTVYFEILR